jgi:hypothetical protein
LIPPKELDELGLANGYRKWTVGIVTLVLIVVATWHWGWNVTVLDYGPKDATRLIPAQVQAGEVVRICYDAITWHRICPTRFTYHVLCNEAGGVRREDFPPYAVSVPDKPGPVVPKCRPSFTVPQACLPGQLKFKAFAESECFPFWAANPRYAYPPELEITVK